MGYVIKHDGTTELNNSSEQTEVKKVGNDFQVNIKTSSTSGKYHFIDCPICKRPNRISLELIAKKKEIDKFLSMVEKENFKRNFGIYSPQQAEDEWEMLNLKRSVADIKCGACGRSLSAVFSQLEKSETDIYTIKEYSAELQSKAEKYETQRLGGIPRAELEKIIKGAKK